MRKIYTVLFLFALCLIQDVLGATLPLVNPPDSVYLFSYSSEKNGGRNGLHFAWSTDQQHWESVGPEMRFLFCDYGRWGKEKRLVSPFLFTDLNGQWHCIWSLNEYDGTFAHSASDDLIYWLPQTYPEVIEGDNCLMPEVSYLPDSKHYKISWLSTAKEGERAWCVTTTDFKKYTAKQEMPLSERLNSRKKVVIAGNEETGIVHKVTWGLVESLINRQKLTQFRDELWAESSRSDSSRFVALNPVKATIAIDPSKSKKISNMLVGIFFEDINYSADGGLYAELIQNRDFEYLLSDKEGNDTTWHNKKCWQLHGEQATFSVDTLTPIHPNNLHYALLKTGMTDAKLSNEGYDGIAITSGNKYNFSVFARNPGQKPLRIKIRLSGQHGEIYGETSIVASSSKWKKYESELTALQTVANAKLEIIIPRLATLHLDMISLFPQDTYKGHKNGLRADLANLLADIKPRFVRFPGGCVAHGDGIGNIYRWKNTVGPLESRKPQRNLWGYHQSVGLGYFEYFQFCEDIGAEPLPVLAAGVPCQNSATGGAGQQGGIPLCEMDEYIQDILDLIEWANGDAKTKWGKVRAEAGHPKPFNLKYIGIGNEDLINDIFEERFTLIYEAIKKQYPEITVIGTVGPSFEGTDYTEGWKIATKLGVPMVDEHYYQSPGWFIYNQDYYDRYDRNKPKVYLGEYASHLPGRPTNIETALSEALYMTALERNGDVVLMASYAPLLAREGHTQWNPNLIYFNGTEAKPTVDYFVQQLFGQNAGENYLPSETTLSNKNEKVRKRISFSAVRDSATGDLILKMVNMLPVTVDAQIDLGNVDAIGKSAVQTVLTGTPEDKNARPVSSAITIGKNHPYIMPAYSFTVLRIKGE